MNAEQWTKVKSIFQRALDATPSERPAILEECVDPEARAEVESLLAAHDSAGSFMSEDSTLAGRALTNTYASGSPAPSSAAFARKCETCGGQFEGRLLVCPVDGGILLDEPEFLVGTTLDGLYEIESLAGCGGFGAVYVARHALLRDRVAVKVLKREMSASPESLRRFLREGRAARSVSHPNIVAIHDLRASDDGFAYLVMEFVEGDTLREALRSRQSFPPVEALEILQGIADALDAAHAQGLVHRDLKPENVMLTGDAGSRSVKVLDLGLAKVLSEAIGEGLGSELTLPGQRMGSPRYMPPEQWGGEEVDARADVYSLGVIAHELVSGKTPFEGSSLAELRRAHMLGAPPASRDTSAVPAEWGQALRKAMAKSPGDRHSSCGAFVEDLRSAGSSGSRRRSMVVAGVLGAAVAISGGLLWVGLPEPAPMPSMQSYPVSPPPMVKPYATMNDSEKLAFVDESVRRVSMVMAGREYGIPPDVRTAILQRIDKYAARVGTGITERGPKEDLRFVLQRGREGAPVIGRSFRALELPPFVGLYIAMIESEFREEARSSMGSRGVFQMLPATAALYGAKPEDLDSLESAAPLAARYIKDGTREFEQDRMGMAMSVVAYNRGFGAVQRYLDEVKVLHDAEAEQRFWAMATNSYPDSPVSAESRRYMIQFFAAAVVGENPSVFALEGAPLTEYAR